MSFHVKNKNSGQELADEILNKIFSSKTGLYSATSRSEYNDLFAAFEQKYSDWFKPAYLEKLKNRLWFESIKPSIVFSSICKKWNTNRVRKYAKYLKIYLPMKNSENLFPFRT